MLLLQEYDFEVVYKLGRGHVTIDRLLRIESGEGRSGVKDQFPYASLFMVHVQSSKIANIMFSFQHDIMYYALHIGGLLAT